MKACFCWIIFLFVALSSNGQSESDSVFLFDRNFNYSPDSNARWVSRKTPNDDSTFIVESGKMDTNGMFRRAFIDKYTRLSGQKLQVERSFWRKGEALPGVYLMDVTIDNVTDSLYQLDLYSRKLNIHKTVFSKTLIPVCPIEKTIFYHPNYSVARIVYHNLHVYSLWNSDGELIDNLIEFEELVDSMPVLANYGGYSFNTALKRFIQQHIIYPVDAKEAGIAGRIYTTFIVTKAGKVEQIEIMFGVHPFIDNAAMDVFRLMEVERPAMKNGEPVDLMLRCPVSFHVH